MNLIATTFDNQLIISVIYYKLQTVASSTLLIWGFSLSFMTVKDGRQKNQFEDVTLASRKLK